MVKVSSLEGSELDYWVAKAEGGKWETFGDYQDALSWIGSAIQYDCWAHAGPIIEREKISLSPQIDGTWSAYSYNQPVYAQEVIGKLFIGSTPLEAAMRCYVASKFGEEVDE